MKKKNITMKDVAALAGVSVSSVSHVINGTRYVERKTKTRIRKAIAVLNYKPNIIDRSLKEKGTETIGIIITDIRDTFFLMPSNLLNPVQILTDLMLFYVMLKATLIKKMLISSYYV